jgi:hypothetical protein
MALRLIAVESALAAGLVGFLAVTDWNPLISAMGGLVAALVGAVGVGVPAYFALRNRSLDLERFALEIKRDADKRAMEIKRDADERELRYSREVAEQKEELRSVSNTLQDVKETHKDELKIISAGLEEVKHITNGMNQKLVDAAKESGRLEGIENERTRSDIGKSIEPD